MSSASSRKRSPFDPLQRTFAVVGFPDDEGWAEVVGHPSASMRFLDYLEQCVLPQLAREGASPLTIRDYRRIGQFFAAVCGNPRLSEIGAACFRLFKEEIQKLPNRRLRLWPGESDADYLRQLLAPSQREGESDEAFAKRRDWTLARPRISQNTQHKMGVTINAILSLAGPPAQDDDDRAFNLLKRAPRMKPPKQEVDENLTVFTAEEYAALLEAAKLMDVPSQDYTGIPPPLFWAGILPFLRGLGPRIGTAMLSEWAWITGRVLAAPRGAMKRHRGRPFYLPSSVLAAIEPLKAFGRPRIFGWPHVWPKGDTWLGRCWQRLCERAGLPPERRLERHAMRRTHGTMLFMADPAAAVKSLGHTRMVTTLTHYVANPEMAALLEKLF